MSAGQLLKQANQLKRAGRLDEAIALYHQVIEINPNFAWAYNNLGDAFVKQRKFSDAISVFERAIQISPKTASYYYSLGKIFVEKNNLNKAINYFQQAIEIQPGFHLAKQALEKLYNKQQENSSLWELTFKTSEISNLFSPFNFEGNWEVQECLVGIYGLFSREIGNSFTIPVEGSKVILVFHRHSWSGKVRVSLGSNNLIVDLYSQVPKYNYRVKLEIQHNFSNLLKIETIEEKNENSLGNECWLLGIWFDDYQSWMSNQNGSLFADRVGQIKDTLDNHKQCPYLNIKKFSSDNQVLKDLNYIKLKIAMLTLAIGDDYIDSVYLGLLTKKECCNIHGYDFICGGYEVYDKNRPIPWSKLSYCKKYLAFYDYIFCSDADVMIMNGSIKLEDIINDYMEDKLIMLTRDGCGNINTGNMFLKNSRETFKILAMIYSQEEYINHLPWENQGFIHLYETNDWIRKRTKLIENNSNLFNSYIIGNEKLRYKKGDFLIHFAGWDDHYSESLSDRMKIYYPESFKSTNI